MDMCAVQLDQPNIPAGNIVFITPYRVAHELIQDSSRYYCLAILIKYSVDKSYLRV